MNAPEKLFLPDVQSSPDERQIVIQKVGVKSIRHPIQIQLSNGPQATIAQIDMTVRLAAHLKGTHMSRFFRNLAKSPCCARLRKPEIYDGKHAQSLRGRCWTHHDCGSNFH